MADRGNYMRDAQWRKGFALLARHCLSFDMQIDDHQAADAAALVRHFSYTTIVVEHIRRYLRQGVATFGARRCLFESNCTPDAIFFDFEAFLETYRDAFSDLSPAAQRDLFCGTAQTACRS